MADRRIIPDPLVGPENTARLRQSFQPRSHGNAGSIRAGDAGEAYREIAQSLRGFNPALAAFAKKVVKEANEKEERKAAAAYRESKMKWADAVKAGKVREGENPHFRRGWRTEELKASLAQFNLGLHTRYVNDPIQESEDPEAVSRWFDKQVADHFGEDQLKDAGDIEVAEVLVPRLDALRERFFAKHTEGLIGKAEKGYSEALSANLMTVLDQIDPTAPDVETFSRAIQEKADEATLNGMNPRAVNKLIVDLVTTKAVEDGNEDYLNLLDKIVTDKKSGAVLGNTGTARAEKLRARKTITVEREANERAAAAEHKRKREEEVDRLGGIAMRASEAGQDASRVIHQLSLLDPSAARAAANYDRARKEEAKETSGAGLAAFSQTLRRMHEDPGNAVQIANSAIGGKLVDAKHYATLVERAYSLKNAEKAPTPELESAKSLLGAGSKPLLSRAGSDLEDDAAVQFQIAVNDAENSLVELNRALKQEKKSDLERRSALRAAAKAQLGELSELFKTLSGGAAAPAPAPAPSKPTAQPTKPAQSGQQRTQDNPFAQFK